MGAVRTNHHLGLCRERTAILQTTTDANHPAILLDHIFEGDALTQFRAGLQGRVQQHLVQGQAPRRQGGANLRARRASPEDQLTHVE